VLKAYIPAKQRAAGGNLARCPNLGWAIVQRNTVGVGETVMANIIPKLYPDKKNRVKIKCDGDEKEYQIALPPSRGGISVTPDNEVRDSQYNSAWPIQFLFMKSKIVVALQYPSISEVHSSIDMLKSVIKLIKERGEYNPYIMINIHDNTIDVHKITDLISTLNALEAEIELIFGSMEVNGNE
jgi:hypothetical protein